MTVLNTCMIVHVYIFQPNDAALPMGILYNLLKHPIYRNSFSDDINKGYCVTVSLWSFGVRPAPVYPGWTQSLLMDNAITVFSMRFRDDTQLR